MYFLPCDLSQSNLFALAVIIYIIIIVVVVVVELVQDNEHYYLSV